MATLDAAIKRLKQQAAELESRFNESADELKDNYGKMAFNSFVGNSIKNIPFIGGILYPWLTDPTVQETVQRVSERFFKLMSVYLQRGISSFFKR